MNCSTPGLPVHHQLLESTQTHVHWVGDAIQPSPGSSCPLLLLPSAFPIIMVFSDESALRIRWPKYWSFSFSISPSMNIQDWFPLGNILCLSLSSASQFSSVQSLSPVRLFATSGIAAHQASLSITNSQSSVKLTSIESVMHSAISSSVVPFSSCPQSLPASESFPMSQLFAWGGQSIGVSASASVLPVNNQDWSHLGLTGWISFQSKGLSRVFSNTTVQKHQFFSTQLSSQSTSHIHTWPLQKP